MDAVEEFSGELLALLRASIAEGDVVLTLARARPNRVVRIEPAGVHVVTQKPEQEGVPQLVPAWMIQAGWDRLRHQGSLTNRELLATDDLNVKRSSAVCALLARLPGVRVVSNDPIELGYG